MTRPVIPPQSEASFHAAVLQLARLNGWTCFHPFDSRRSEAGWPDLFLLRPPRALAAELKTETGRVTPAQTRWLELLGQCGIEAQVWRPSQKQAIAEVLR